MYNCLKVGYQSVKMLSCNMLDERTVFSRQIRFISFTPCTTNYLQLALEKMQWQTSISILPAPNLLLWE